MGPAARRTAILVLLFLATVLNYLDRQVLSVTAPILRLELHMTASDYSRVVFAFMLAYTVMQALAGRMVDRLGTRAGLAIAMLWWSAAGSLHALARTPWHLAACRFLLGAGEAANWPASVKVVGEWFTPRNRAAAVGFFNAGSSLGAVVAPPLITWIALGWSWRLAFLLTGGLGLLWFIPWWFLARTGPFAAPASSAASAISTRSWFGLAARREVFGLMLARFFGDPVWWFYVFWLPDYLRHSRNLPLATIGYVAWLPFFTAGIGNIYGGVFSAWLIRRGAAPIRARLIVMIWSAAAMTTGVFAYFTSSSSLSLAIISFVTFAYSCWAANILTLPTDITGPESTASVVGLNGFAAGLGGMLSTLSIGWFVDHFSYAPPFIAAALSPLAAAAAALYFLRPASREVHP